MVWHFIGVYSFMLISALKEKFRISTQPCNILYFYFLATRILVLATKNEILEASWPQDFFLEVELCIKHSPINFPEICFP